jgi:hypothetical protein
VIIPIERKMPRVQEVIMPTLQESLEAKYPGINVTSWYKDVTRRSFPFINVRRVSGNNDAKDPDVLDHAVIEMTAYTNVSYPATEDLYMDARYIIYQMWKQQVVIEGVGYIHSFFETLSPLQFDSPFDGTWRVQGMIQLGMRPVRQ